MKKLHNAAAAAVAAALACFGTGAQAGGFAIGVQSGSATGNAIAGGAAIAEDASVVWSNPAGMMALKTSRELTVVVHAFRPSFEFRNGGSTGVFAAGGSGEGGDGGDWAYVPNTYFVMAINPRLKFGVGINVPFGLKTNYDVGWRGQITALKSKVESININPAIAYKVNDIVSVGVGVSAQRLKAELSSFSGVAALGNLMLSADDWGFGYNVGATIQAARNTRLGVAYRSSIKYRLEGNALFDGPVGGVFNTPVTAALRVPDSASFSVFHTPNRNWELLGDVTWTGWKHVQALTVVRTNATPAGAAGSNFAVLPFQWKNTWRLGAGANYKLDDQFKIRTGIAYDQTPTADAFRTARLPDQDRRWIAAGIQYRLSRAGVLDAGYAHEFIRDARVNNITAAGTLSGTFDNKADIFSLQYSHAF